MAKYDQLAALIAAIDALEKRIENVESFLEDASEAEAQMDPLEEWHQRNLERLRDQ